MGENPRDRCVVEKSIKLYDRLDKNPNHETKWRATRKGVLIFCIIHILFEILTGNNKSAAFPVMFNFWISAWFIKEQIAKGKEMKNLLRI